jgi:hypothetical protein
MHATHPVLARFPPLQRAGEAEAASTRKPSCMPDFAGMTAFEAYVGGATSAAAPLARGVATAAALAAAAAAVLL